MSNAVLPNLPKGEHPVDEEIDRGEIEEVLSPQDTRHTMVCSNTMIRGIQYRSKLAVFMAAVR